MTKDNQSAEIDAPKEGHSLDYLLTCLVGAATRFEQKHLRADGLALEAYINQIKARAANLSESRAIERQIKTYQQILMWLEDQEDSDALALLAKDISVELDKLFKELKERI